MILLPILLRFMGEKAARTVAALIPYLIGAGLVLAAYLWAYDRGRDAQRTKDAAAYATLDAAFKQTEANVRIATAAAEAADLAHKQAVESAQATVSERTDHDLQTQLVAARADAARYAARLSASQAGTAVRGGAAAGVPGVPGATSGAAVADRQTVLDDANACAAAVTVAEAWQAWWKGQVAVRR